MTRAELKSAGAGFAVALLLGLGALGARTCSTQAASPTSEATVDLEHAAGRLEELRRQEAEVRERLDALLRRRDALVERLDAGNDASTAELLDEVRREYAR